MNMSDELQFAVMEAEWRRGQMRLLRAENKRLRELLTRTHAAWMLEASQGDGIMEEHVQVDRDCRAALAETESQNAYTSSQVPTDRDGEDT